ncbi:MAG: transcriptional repressor [Candidatus Caldatribacteriota bacterium]|nr:transcriptional repressor [Candidatus Caldatribacteriota bacterium]
MITAEQKFEEFLKIKELKYTSERKLIVKTILSFHKHFNVEEVFEKLRKQGNHISRATIYRAIPLLLKSGLISEALRCQDKISYENIFNKKHHDHLLCVKCGKIIEFYNEKIEKLQEEVCRQHNFVPIEHRLGIKGYCEDCYKKIKEEKK